MSIPNQIDRQEYQFGIPEEQALKIKEMKIEQKPSPAFTPFMQKLLNEAVETNWYDREEISPQEFRGWRPTCLLCRKSVQTLRVWRDEATCCYGIEMSCHGRRERMQIDQYVASKRRGGLREIIELRGAFRRDADKAGPSPWLREDLMEPWFDPSMEEMQRQMAAKLDERILRQAMEAWQESSAAYNAEPTPKPKPKPAAVLPLHLPRVIELE